MLVTIGPLVLACAATLAAVAMVAARRARAKPRLQRRPPPRRDDALDEILLRLDVHTSRPSPPGPKTPGH